MAIKSFLFSPRSYNLLVILFLMGCQNLPTVSHRDFSQKNEIEVSKKSDSQQTSTPTINESVPDVNLNREQQPTVVTNANKSTPFRKDPRFGIIVGPGGAHTFAAIAALQEIQKLRLPVKAIAGIEFGAIPAALYAQNLSGNEVEWQMLKLKDEDFENQSLISRGAREVDFSKFQEFLSQAFNRSKVENGKIPFACPSYNLKKSQNFMMSRGDLDKLLPYCVVYPPLFRPYQASVAGVREFKASADWLKTQGANYILLINTVSPSQNDYFSNAGLSAQVAWAEIAAYSTKPQGVDMILNLNIDNFKVDDFSSKREIFQRNSDMISGQIRAWARQFGY